MRLMTVLSMVGLVLGPLAMAPVATPAMAQAACTNWVAEPWEDEGGPVLTAAACALDNDQVFLSLTCHGGTVAIRHDLGYGAERSAQYDERAMVAFTSDDGTAVTLDMGYEDMDGKFAAYLPKDAPVVALLMAGREVAVRDEAGIFPSRSYSLAGSGAALKALMAGCS